MPTSARLPQQPATVEFQSAFRAQDRGQLGRRVTMTMQEKLQLLGKIGQPHAVAAHAEIVGMGDRADTAFLVLEGLLARYDQNRIGDRQITALYIPGDTPGACSWMYPAATGGLEALTDSVLLAVPQDDLYGLLTGNPAAARALWCDLMAESMIMSRWLVNLGRSDAKTRVAHLLCEMACRYGLAPRQGRVVYQLPMTQQHLAETTGLTCVHINRTLKWLERWGISFRHKTVRIEDWDQLVTSAEFDPSYLAPLLAAGDA